ncbi:hypothetical protein LSH36_1787g00007 [Paralvinella palmiformis]|uniref:EF-hand domain-containing protein n=1 Tax=Paralvinella palmiformis TaxID=53620 RepID=A0AAD9ISG9_9ANNE|nr:hypothetical protein LSH36_1787g00007 [Paralvinella palmiformis]
MGCSGSKTAESPKSKPEGQQENKGDENKEAGVYITEDEAIQYIVNELATTEERAKKIVAQVNHNDDGKISNEELVEMWAKCKERRAELKSEFEEIDKDKSGYITTDEAVQVFSKRFTGLPEASVKAIIKRYDSDGSGKLRYDEFIYFYGNMIVKRETIVKEFEKLDPDNKGQLPASDLERILVDVCVIDDYMAKSLVEDCDMNKDGLINRQEFEKLLNDMFE